MKVTELEEEVEERRVGVRQELWELEKERAVEEVRPRMKETDGMGLAVAAWVEVLEEEEEAPAAETPAPTEEVLPTEGAAAGGGGGAWIFLCFV